MYLLDLLNLEEVKPLPVGLPHGLPHPHAGPLRLAAWDAALRSHPDKRFCSYILNGLRWGFHVGFHRARDSLRSSRRNIPSAYEHPEVVDKYLLAEQAAGRILGPFPSPPHGLHISRFGVIPKKSQPGKWRLIVDLSSPHGFSVNDGVSEALCSLRYPSFDLAIKLLLRQGQGALLSKLDIKEAYRMVPVHREDWLLLGMQWRGASYVDTRLPFGLRSAPKIFTAVADALQWIMVHQGLKCFLHYLDDFLFVEPPNSAGSALQTALSLWDSLGVPVAPNKAEGPTTSLVFLGIELDSASLTARLPADKLSRLQQLVHEWGDKKVCLKRDLLSLIGVLQHAASVVRFGRCFLRRMIDLSSSVSELHHHIRLNREFRSDLQWWATFTPQWNGICMLAPMLQDSPSIIIHSDASGSWGFGAYASRTWFQGKWPAQWANTNITAKELLPIVLAAGVWGRTWTSQFVEFRCDNEAIVGAITSWRSKEPLVMHLLRGLALVAMEFSFHLRAVHIAGTANSAADALSRNNLPSFFLQVPQAQPSPDPIPPELTLLFLHQQPDWLSNTWRDNFKRFCQQESLNPQPNPMLQGKDAICSSASRLRPQSVQPRNIS